MSGLELPSPIKAFLSHHIRSIEQLEILLLLSSQPVGLWTVQQVYDTILSTPSSVERWLIDLVGQGLLEKVSGSPASYRCCSDEARISQIAAVAGIYRTSPVRVIEAIYRRENSAVQSFADAFKLKPTNPTP